MTLCRHCGRLIVEVIAGGTIPARTDEPPTFPAGSVVDGAPGGYVCEGCELEPGACFCDRTLELRQTLALEAIATELHQVATALGCMLPI